MNTMEMENRVTLPEEGGRVGFLGIKFQGKEGSKENTGNYLHGFAARHIVGEYRDLHPSQLKDDEYVETLQSELTHVALIAATTIGVNKAEKHAVGHRAMADAIEKLGLPVVVFGLGAQAKIGQSVSDAVVAPDTKHLLSVLSHHSPKIAVRGQFTADLCKHLGINNVEVVGCQSCFLSRRPDFQMPELSNTPTSLDRIAVNFTRHSQELPLLLEAMEREASYIGQSSHFEYALARIESDIPVSDLPDEIKALMTKGMKNIIDANRIDFGKFHGWVRNNFFQYYSMEPWFEKLRSGFDACIGTRFHGNMTAMQAGVPALWIVHDSRTQEFCDHLGLPQAPLQAVRDGLSIAELFDRHYETETFARKYPQNYARFYDYLTEHGVPHKLAAPVTN